MHVLFLSHYYPPEVNAPASRTAEHAKRWVKSHGAQVTVVTNHPNHPKGELYGGYVNRWVTREELDGVFVVRVKTILTPNAGVVRRTANYLFFMIAASVAALKVQRADVIVATSPQFFCAVAGYVVSKLKRKPFVFELRDIWPESIVTVGALRPSRILQLVTKLELFLYRNAALIVVVTDAFREILIERGVPAAKIAVVKNGVDLEFFKPMAPPRRLQEQLGTTGKFVAAYIGTIGMAHAVDKLVDAAEILSPYPDIVILIVGEGANRAKVEQMVKRKMLTNVRVLPGVGKDEVRDYYSLADVNLVTLRNQPLFRSVIPSKIFEIMAMARPILSTVHGETRVILESAGSAVFAEPENAIDIAEQLVRLRRSGDLLSKMGRAGRSFVEQHYSRDRSASDMLNHLIAVTERDVAHRRHAPSREAAPTSSFANKS